MKKAIMGVAACGLVGLACTEAQAATRFDIVFTGLTSNMAWSPASKASGTGFVEVDGFTGAGSELFGGADPTRTVVSFKVELASGMFDGSVTPPGYPRLSTLDGVGANFELIGYRFSPAVALFSPLSPGNYQLVTTEATYTGVYRISRHLPPDVPGPTPPGDVTAPDSVSPVPEPAVWVSLIAGFFGLGAMLRLRRCGALGLLTGRRRSL